MLRDIVDKPVPMKDNFSPEAKSLLSSLLTRDPSKRLGSANAEATDILEHPFFRNINWPELRAQKTKPPFKPVVRNAKDTSQIDKMFTDEAPKETPDQSMTGSAKNKTNFVGFTYDQNALERKQ